MAYCEHCGAPLVAPEVAAAPVQVGDAGAADAIAQAQAVLNQVDAGDQPAPADAEATAQPSSAPADTAAKDAAASTPAAIAVDAAQGTVQAPEADAAEAPVADAAAPAPAPVAPQPAPALTISFGDSAQYTVQQDVTNVGRSDIAQNWHPELDVIPFGGGAPDFGVSRHQAVIQRQGAAYSIVDVGSTNGTFVNGHVLEYNKPAELHDGDTVAFGAFSGKVTIA